MAQPANRRLVTEATLADVVEELRNGGVGAGSGSGDGGSSADAEAAADRAEAAADSVTTEVALVRSDMNDGLDGLASVDAALSARVTALEQVPPPAGGGDVDDSAMLVDYLAARG